MYTIKDISEIIGWSPRQIYDRMKQIDGFMGSFTQRGKKNKILVGNDGFKILRKLNDLENDDLSIKQASKIVHDDMENSDGKSTKDNDRNKSQGALLESYKKQIVDLKQQIREKDRLINWFQDLVKNGENTEVKLDENKNETKRFIEYPH